MHGRVLQIVLEFNCGIMESNMQRQGRRECHRCIPVPQLYLKDWQLGEQGCSQAFLFKCVSNVFSISIYPVTETQSTNCLCTHKTLTAAARQLKYTYIYLFITHSRFHLCFLTLTCSRSLLSPCLIEMHSRDKNSLSVLLNRVQRNAWNDFKSSVLEWFNAGEHHKAKQESIYEPLQ